MIRSAHQHETLESLTPDLIGRKGLNGQRAFSRLRENKYCANNQNENKNFIMLPLETSSLINLNVKI